MPNFGGRLFHPPAVKNAGDNVAATVLLLFSPRYVTVASVIAHRLFAFIRNVAMTIASESFLRDFPFCKKHPEHIVPEDGFQLFQLQKWGDAKHALVFVETAVRHEEMVNGGYLDFKARSFAALR